jgi:hypothetical protein
MHSVNKILVLNIVPLPNVIKHYVIKAYGGVDVKIRVFVTCTLV